MAIEPEEEQAIAQLLGAPFLAYVLSVPVEDAQARLDGVELTEPFEQAFHDLIRHTTELMNVPNGYPDGPPSALVRRLGWVDMDREQSHANLFRLATGGELPPVPDGSDEVEAAVAAAAIDYFPLTLIPVTPGQLFPGKPLISGARVEALEAALHAIDDPLLRLFAPEDGAEFAYYTSTGMGYGGLWPFRVAECALATAEQLARAFGDQGPRAYVDRALRNLNLMRAMANGDTVIVPALATFERAEIPPGTTLAAPRGGVLRATTERDPRAPVSTTPTMTLETTCAVSLSIGRLPPGGNSDFWLGNAELGAECLLVSLAGLLATSSEEDPSLPFLRGTRIFDPFQPYVGSFVPMPGAPTPLFPIDHLPGLEEWLLRLAEHYDPSIRIAVRRCISAFSERPDYDDALVDFVIALENLFLTRGPKLRQRMAVALGNLLADSPESRESIEQTARAVYDARSDLVHGDQLADTTFGHPRDDAARLVLRAFEVLFKERPELIADKRARARLGRTGEQ